MIHTQQVEYTDPITKQSRTRNVRLTINLPSLIYHMLPNLKTSKKGITTLCFGLIKLEWTS